jgi:hypothetical protein
MEWTEPALIEYAFRFGAKQRQALARLGFPRLREGDREWSCAFQIQGLKESKVRRARGVDGLQALTIASMVVRKSLDSLKMINTDSAPYEIVFPRYLPFCAGLGFHRKLCKIVDIEIKKKQTQLSREFKTLEKKRGGRA